MFRRKDKEKERIRTRNVSMSSNISGTPYNELSRDTRTPTVVSTIRQSGGQNISAPITNPTLTSNGTDFNVNNPRSRTSGFDGGPEGASRMKTMSPPPSSPSPGSNSTHTGFPRASYPVEVSDSNTSYSQPRSSTSSRDLPSTISGVLSTISQPTARDSKRNGGSSSDLGHYSASTTSAPPSRTPSSLSNHTPRPPSRNDALTRQSVTPSVSSTTSESHHPHLNRILHRGEEEFYYPRPPDDDEIDVLFMQMISARAGNGIQHTGKIDIETKWQLVYNHEHERWLEERRNAAGRRRAMSNSGPNAAYTKDTPEWYLKKFMDRTVTPKDVNGLSVAIRSFPIEWVYFGFLSSESS